MTLLNWLPAALTTGFLYVMGAVPFAVWSGRTVYASVLANASAPDGKGRLRPGLGATLWLVVLPACLIAYAVFRGFDVPDDSNPYAADEWGQVLFLMLRPDRRLRARLAARPRQSAPGRMNFDIDVAPFAK